VRFDFSRRKLEKFSTPLGEGSRRDRRLAEMLPLGERDEIAKLAAIP
jgi:hypothetical protein